MGQRTWREIASIKVPEREGCAWTPMLDYLTPGKMYRLEVRMQSVPTPPEPRQNGITSEVPQDQSAMQQRDDQNLAASRSRNAPEGDQSGPAPQDDKLAQSAQVQKPAQTQEEHSAKVSQDQKWRPESAGECTADGNPATERSDSLLITGAAVGALVAKIGGSTADLKPEKEKVVLFAVGRHCVFTVDATKAGALYLGANDSLASLVRVEGQLEVVLSEAL